MSKFWTIVTIADGKIVNTKAVRVLFDSLKDGKYIVEINSANKRSDAQNRYYWGLVIPMIQKGIKHLGHEMNSEEIHEFLKSKFNSVEVVNQETGEMAMLPQSTTRLNKEQFGEYIEKIQRFAAEFLSMEIPDPGVQTQMNY